MIGLGRCGQVYVRTIAALGSRCRLTHVGTRHPERLNSPLLRVNGDFMGVVVPSGSHEIHLNFQPESRYYGRLLGCFGLGLMVVTLLLTARPVARWPRWLRAPFAQPDQR